MNAALDVVGIGISPIAPESAPAPESLPAPASLPSAEAGADAAPDALEPVLLPPRGLVACVLAALAVIAASAIVWAPAVRPALQPDLVLSTWRESIDVAEARRRDDATAAAAHPVAARGGPRVAEAQLRSALQDWLAREAELGAEDVAADPTARAMLGRAEEAARTLALAHGNDSLRAAAVHYGRAVRAATEAALVLARQRHTQLHGLLAAAPADPEVQTLTRLAGGLALALVPAGLEAWLGPGGGLDPVVGRVVEALAQGRVLALGVRLPTGAPPLASDDVLLLLRFRAEAHPGLTLDRRLRRIEELAHADPAYPAQFARGVWFAREELWTEAAAAFVAAARAGEEPERAHRNARWCARRAAAQVQ